MGQDFADSLRTYQERIEFSVAPKFLSGIDKYLLGYNLGENWKQYYEFRFSFSLSLIYLIMFAIVNPTNADLGSALIGVGVVGIMAYAWQSMMCKWGRITRRLLLVGASFLTLVILLYAWKILTRIF